MNWLTKWFKLEHTPIDLREIRKQCALRQVSDPGVKKLITEYCDRADLDDNTYGYWTIDKKEWVLSYVDKFIWDTLYVNGSVVYHPDIPVEEPTIALANSLINDGENWQIRHTILSDPNHRMYSYKDRQFVFSLTYSQYGLEAVGLEGFNYSEKQMINFAACEFERKNKARLSANNRAKVAALFEETSLDSTDR